ncbi:CD225/dispanin family protein [Haoranjiania flava]
MYINYYKHKNYLIAMNDQQIPQGQGGYQQQPQQPFSQQNVNPNFQNTGAAPPKTWLVESILVTIFCCLPLGVIGIINASKVESKYYAGDVQGSLQASQEAKKWTKIGLICGLVGLVLYVILIFAGVLTGIAGMGS